MEYKEAVQTIQPGRYRHFKGNEYEVVGIARHSEIEEPVVVYRALYENTVQYAILKKEWEERKCSS